MATDNGPYDTTFPGTVYALSEALGAGYHGRGEEPDWDVLGSQIRKLVEWLDEDAWFATHPARALLSLAVRPNYETFNCTGAITRNLYDIAQGCVGDRDAMRRFSSGRTLVSRRHRKRAEEFCDTMELVRRALAPHLADYEKETGWWKGSTIA
ncbi:MAG TPA: hypothetical protein VHT03_06385 [Rhizomicrobium sp.]|jgi:hypothetical protein|nr:hypothetical protein [Rhizomicrobium sp.]